MSKLFGEDHRKYSFLSRIAAILVSVLLLVCSLFLILFSLNVFGEERVILWVRSILGDLQLRILLIAGSLISVLLCIFVLRPSGKRDDPLRSTAMISRSEAGGTFISLSAIESMVDRFLDSQPHIQLHKATVQNGSGGVRIDLRVVVSDADISVLSEKLHRSLDEYIGAVAGIPVKSIRILIDEADIPAPEPEREGSDATIGSDPVTDDSACPEKDVREGSCADLYSPGSEVVPGQADGGVQESE